MALLDLRFRAGYLFLGVMFAYVILISAQINTRRGVPVLEEVIFGGFAEAQRAVSGGVSLVRRVLGGYIGLRGVRSENEALRKQLAEANVELQSQRALAGRTLGLERLLELRERVPLLTTWAAIIGAGASPEFRTVTIDKGTSDGLRRDLAVLAPAGVVGRLVVPSRRNAQVQLLIDRSAAAGALIERSLAQGVVVGTGESRLRLDYVSEAFDVVAGDVVVTSGIDAIYPKGLVIGRVAAVERAGGAYRLITVEPAVDFSTLEDVLVVLTRPSQEQDEDGPRETVP